MVHRGKAGWLAVVLLLSACSRGALPVVTAAPTTLAAACTVLYQHYAAWTQRCTGFVLGPTAVRDLAVDCGTRAALPGMTVTPTALSACAARIDTTDCGYLPDECVTSLDSSGTYTAVNRNLGLEPGTEGEFVLFPQSTGTLGDGSLCDVDAQCASGLCVVPGSGDGCGLCGGLRRAGEACMPSDQCTYGSNCTNGACVEWGQTLAAACQVGPKGGSDCQRSLYCDSPGGQLDDRGTCVARAAVGAPCRDLFLQETCVEGSLCRHGACVSTSIAAEGEPCDNDVVRCGVGRFCSAGVCRKPASGVGLGGDCGFDLCAAGLACSYGGCVLPAGLGEACDPATRPCGPGLLCYGAACVAPPCGAGSASASATDPQCAPRLAGEPCPGFDHRPCAAGLMCADWACRPIAQCSTAGP